MRPLVERYLASLPAQARNEAARDVGIRPPTGVVEKTVLWASRPRRRRSSSSPARAATATTTASYSARLRDLLDIRLREALREDKGGTYGVDRRRELPHIPTERYEITVSFGSAPERTDELVKAVFAVIDSVKAGPSPTRIS